jgi:hypothetical protein
MKTLTKKRVFKIEIRARAYRLQARQLITKRILPTSPPSVYFSIPKPYHARLREMTQAQLSLEERIKLLENIMRVNVALLTT